MPCVTTPCPLVRPWRDPLQPCFSRRFLLNSPVMSRARLASQHMPRILLLAALALAGCQSTSALPTEDRVADFAAIKSRANNVQLNLNRVSIDAARGKPLELAVHETTNAQHDRLFVFVHGV